MLPGALCDSVDGPHKQTSACRLYRMRRWPPSYSANGRRSAARDEMYEIRTLPKHHGDRAV